MKPRYEIRTEQDGVVGTARRMMSAFDTARDASIRNNDLAIVVRRKRLVAVFNRGHFAQNV